MLQSDNWELAFVCSQYQSATEEVNSQIAQINDIVKEDVTEIVMNIKQLSIKNNGNSGRRVDDSSD